MYLRIKAERPSRGGGHMSFPEKIDVHGYDEKIRNQKLLLEETKMHKNNKQAIRDFVAYCKADPKVGGSWSKGSKSLHECYTA